MTTLIVEDNAIARLMMARAASSVGNRVVEFSTHDEARDYLAYNDVDTVVVSNMRGDSECFVKWIKSFTNARVILVRDIQLARLREENKTHADSVLVMPKTSSELFIEVGRVLRAQPYTNVA
jgi:DNA-binding response OmpR family regulator